MNLFIVNSGLDNKILEIRKHIIHRKPCTGKARFEEYTEIFVCTKWRSLTRICITPIFLFQLLCNGTGVLLFAKKFHFTLSFVTFHWETYFLRPVFHSVLKNSFHFKIKTLKISSGKWTKPSQNMSLIFNVNYLGC